MAYHVGSHGGPLGQSKAQFSLPPYCLTYISGKNTHGQRTSHQRSKWFISPTVQGASADDQINTVADYALDIC